MLQKIESNFNVIYPDNKNATYASLLNYSSESENPFQRWYRYKEGFSIQFIEKIIDEYSTKDIKILLDPFAGSGTTIIAANRMGIQGIGFEVNPFSYFLMKVKAQQYTELEINDFCSCYEQIIRELVKDELETYTLPLLSFSHKVFQKEAEQYMMSCKVKINMLEKGKVWDLLFLGWLACIEQVSNYRKAGNGLKKRKTVKPIIVGKKEVINTLIEQYNVMSEDLRANEGSNIHSKNKIYQKSSLGFASVLGQRSVDGIIFSPPYANCFDYTEIYKLELWFGDFVKSYDDLKESRAMSLKSHLNIKYTYEDLITSAGDTLSQLLSKVQGVDLWDKRIPHMLFGYFNDMFNIIDNCYAALKEKGFCAIVVGNSAYGGIIIPTDLILAEYAKKIGFVVDKIEVDRFIITSSQQYEKTKQDGKYLRESVICLVK